MTSAILIEVRGAQVGLVVPERSGGVRFFAATADAYALDGANFPSPLDARRAVKAAIAAGTRREVCPAGAGV